MTLFYNSKSCRKLFGLSSVDLVSENKNWGGNSIQMQNSFQVYSVEKLLMGYLEINEISCKSYSFFAFSFFFYEMVVNMNECMNRNA